MSRTQYKVLFLDNGGWTEFDSTVEATSAKSAIRAAITGPGITEAGIFVAVPARSWQPKAVEIETQQHLKIG